MNLFLRSRKNILLILSIIIPHEVRNVHRRINLIVARRNRIPDPRKHGQNARPDSSLRVLIFQIMLVVMHAAVAKLCAAGGDADPEDAGALHLGGRGRLAGGAPAAGDDAVCDELHGVELLGVVGDEGGVAEEGGGAVVVGVGEGGGGEDEGVDVGCGDADGEAFLLLLLNTLRGRGRAGEVHHAGGDVAVEVEVEGVAEVRAGAVKGAHVADHGEDGWEGRVVGGVEGDVEERGGVDEGVDCFEGVGCAVGFAADGVCFCFEVFEGVAAHFDGVVDEGEVVRRDDVDVSLMRELRVVGVEEVGDVEVCVSGEKLLEVGLVQCSLVCL